MYAPYIIPPYRMSGAPVLHHCCFLEPLLSICSAMSESKAESQSCHSHEAGVSFCFPKVLTSLWRVSSLALSSVCLVSALWQCSVSGESFSSSDFAFLVTSSYQLQYHDSLLWASSMASSSMCVTICGYTVQNASPIQ